MIINRGQSVNKILSGDGNYHDIEKNRIEYIRARELLVKDRIDLVAKYKYVEAYDKGIQIPFINQLYYAHLEALTKGSFIERGKENAKKSYEDYVAVFEQLIESIREKGIQKEISIIPVGKNNTILNGSHRVAVAIYYDLIVPIVRFEEVEVRYDYEYFKKCLLEQRYLDYMVTEYIRLKENVFFACIWPRADKDKAITVEKMIEKYCDIVYKSSVELSYHGLENLMIQIYGKQKWCGNVQNGYKGVFGKVNECFQDNVKTVIYVLDNTEVDKIVDLKRKIRAFYQIGNSSLHISDNAEESLEIAHLLLNRNSVDILNYGQIYKYKKYIQKIQQLSGELKERGIDRENFLICSSGVLGVYGIRNPNDVDYLAFDDMKKYSFSVKMEAGDEKLQYFDKTKEELVYNPENYLFAYGIKFNILSVLSEMKKNRNEVKDREDCLLIAPYIQSQAVSWKRSEQYRIKIMKFVRNRRTKIKFYIGIGLKKIHLYDAVKHYYDVLIG